MGLVTLVRVGLLSRHKIWKENYYLNDGLFELLMSVGAKPMASHE